MASKHEISHIDGDKSSNPEVQEHGNQEARAYEHPQITPNREGDRTASKAKLATLGEKRPREASSPEDVDAEVEGEVQEELVEMAQVGGVAVGVEHGGRGVRVAHVHRRQRVPLARAEAQYLDVLPVGLAAERGDPGPGVLHQRVRRRRRREEGHLRRHARRHPSHPAPPRSPSASLSLSLSRSSELACSGGLSSSNPEGS